jgi:predicted small integral membrane protein
MHRIWHPAAFFTGLALLATMVCPAGAAETVFPGASRFPVEAGSGQLLTMYLFKAPDVYHMTWIGAGCGG